MDQPPSCGEGASRDAAPTTVEPAGRYRFGLVDVMVLMTAVALALTLHHKNQSVLRPGLIYALLLAGIASGSQMMVVLRARRTAVPENRFTFTLLLAGYVTGWLSWIGGAWIAIYFVSYQHTQRYFSEAWYEVDDELAWAMLVIPLIVSLALTLSVRQPTPTAPRLPRRAFRPHTFVAALLAILLIWNVDVMLLPRLVQIAIHAIEANHSAFIYQYPESIYYGVSPNHSLRERWFIGTTVLALLSWIGGVVGLVVVPAGGRWRGLRAFGVASLLAGTAANVAHLYTYGLHQLSPALASQSVPRYRLEIVVLVAILVTFVAIAAAFRLTQTWTAHEQQVPLTVQGTRSTMHVGPAILLAVGWDAVSRSVQLLIDWNESRGGTHSLFDWSLELWNTSCFLQWALWLVMAQVWWQWRRNDAETVVWQVPRIDRRVWCQLFPRVALALALAPPVLMWTAMAFWLLLV